MGGDLLKKTGAANLFMVLGAPDVAIIRSGDELEVELRGVDVYDQPPAPCPAGRPTTSPAGSSTPATTARASSFATPTSPGRTTLPPAAAGASLRGRRGGVGVGQLDDQPAVPGAEHRQGGHQGDQPLRRRGDAGLRRRVTSRVGRRRPVPNSVGTRQWTGAGGTLTPRGQPLHDPPLAAAAQSSSNPAAECSPWSRVANSERVRRGRRCR